MNPSTSLVSPSPTTVSVTAPPRDTWSAAWDASTTEAHRFTLTDVTDFLLTVTAILLICGIASYLAHRWDLIVWHLRHQVWGRRPTSARIRTHTDTDAATEIIPRVPPSPELVQWSYRNGSTWRTRTPRPWPHLPALRWRIARRATYFGSTSNRRNVGRLPKATYNAKHRGREHSR